MALRSSPGYLEDQYEALRKQALGTQSASQPGQGLALFWVGGMPGGLAALDVLAPPTARSCRPRESGSLDCRMDLPSLVRPDLTSVLADMILALRSEATI